MDNAKLKTLAAALGFRAAYFLPLPDYPKNEDEPHIVWSAEAFPWARASLLLVWAYTPYDKDGRIPAYYVNSNESYHASVALAKSLEAEGFACFRCEIPIKQMAARYGVARSLKNSLVEIPPFGTRTVIQTMLLGEPFRPETYSIEEDSLCLTCRACEKACPAHAIGENGYEVKKCMRFYMDGADYPEWVYGMQKTHLGCEICQEVCPRNAAIGFIKPPPEVTEAFDLKRLAAGDTAAARRLVGKNITGHGKLTKEAEHFLKKASPEQNIP